MSASLCSPSYKNVSLFSNRFFPCGGTRESGNRLNPCVYHCVRYHDRTRVHQSGGTHGVAPRFCASGTHFFALAPTLSTCRCVSVCRPTSGGRARACTYCCATRFPTVVPGLFSRSSDGCHRGRFPARLSPGRRRPRNRRRPPVGVCVYIFVFFFSSFVSHTDNSIVTRRTLVSFAFVQKTTVCVQIVIRIRS